MEETSNDISVCDTVIADLILQIACSQLRLKGNEMAPISFPTGERMRRGPLWPRNMLCWGSWDLHGQKPNKNKNCLREIVWQSWPDSPPYVCKLRHVKSWIIKWYTHMQMSESAWSPFLSVKKVPVWQFFNSEQPRSISKEPIASSIMSAAVKKRHT